MKANFDPLTTAEIREHQSTCNGEPSIYLGTYRKYNEGSLFGQWIDLTSFYDYDDFCEYCNRLHSDEDDPEFMVQDFEGYPESMYHESGLPTEDEFDRIQVFAELDEDEQEAYQIYLDNYNENADLDEFRDHYEGKFEDGADFDEHICEEFGYLESLPNWLQYCIDYNAVWRTLDTGGDFSEYDGHIFR